MLIGTLFIHISFHAAGMASVIAATGLMFGFEQGLVFLPVLLLVVLARLVLGRHTPAQIILGTLIGAPDAYGRYRRHGDARLAPDAQLRTSQAAANHARQTRAVPSQDQDSMRVPSRFQLAPLTRLRCRKRRGAASSQR